jgi:hypothetical protein
VFNATQKVMHTGQMGRLPIVSRKDSKYLMVAVEMDGNYINSEPMKIRKAKSLIKVYQAIWERWSSTRAVAPNWHVLDNEAPLELKQQFVRTKHP